MHGTQWHPRRSLRLNAADGAALRCRHGTRSRPARRFAGRRAEGMSAAPTTVAPTRDAIMNPWLGALAVDALTLARNFPRAVLRAASARRRPDRVSAPPHRRPGHARTPRLGPMTARSWQTSELHGVLIARPAEGPRALQIRPLMHRATREVLGARVAAASCPCSGVTRLDTAARRGHADDREG